MTKTKGFLPVPEDIMNILFDVPVTPTPTIKVSNILILANPIKVTDDLYSSTLPLFNEGNRVMFKFQKGTLESSYEVESMCLNFRYENLVEVIERLGLTTLNVNLFEWLDDDDDEWLSSLFINDNRITGMDEWFYTYMDTNSLWWPPKRRVIKG